MSNTILFPLAKVGKTVQIPRRDGSVAVGKVAFVPAEVTRNTFVRVNIGDKKKPQILSVRPSQLSKV